MNETWWVEESELDEDQIKIMALGLKSNHLLMGPPGSGKTNLLLLRANYLALAGKPNLLILVFTRPLKEFIVSGAVRYNFSVKKIQTYNNWARKLLGEYGISVPRSKDFTEERNNLITGLKSLIEQEQITLDYFDAILLDEAHDYLIDELKILRKFTKDIFAVADSRQQIYHKDSKAIEYLKNHLTQIELNYHYRNGVNICKLADLITKNKIHVSLQETSRYNESARPSTVKYFKCMSIDKQLDLIIKELETQLKAYPKELLGVLCPTKEIFNLVKQQILSSSLGNLCIFQDRDSGYAPFDSEHPICVSTLHASKGLEFRAVHIIACDAFYGFPTTNRNLTFTGITRAKTSLTLYYIDEMYGYLASALAEMFPRHELPRISEAFGQGD